MNKSIRETVSLNIGDGCMKNLLFIFVTSLFLLLFSACGNERNDVPELLNDTANTAESQPGGLLLPEDIAATTAGEHMAITWGYCNIPGNVM